jgi:6,7-dimethyl-8-ribityllumazine synthase
MRGGEDRSRPDLDASGMHVAIVAARFNEQVVDRLLDGALAALREMGADDDRVEVRWVPGAFELPLVLDRLAGTGRYDALVALGAVIRGETAHFDFVAGAASDGIAAVARERGVPIGFGVLTTDTVDQALARSGGEVGDHGAEAARTAVEVARLIASL